MFILHVTYPASTLDLSYTVTTARKPVSIFLLLFSC